jgi:hypothetical protein
MKTSELVEQYVGSVKDFVRLIAPGSDASGIAAEIGDAVHNRIEERETELGRKLKEPEVEALLGDFGHPMAVAARYAPQRSLIGPTVYPYWRLGVIVFTAVAAIAFTARSIGVLFTTTGDVGRAYSNAWGSFFTTELWFVGLVTLIAAAAERSGWDPFKDWRAKDLKSIRLTRPRSRVSSALTLVFNIAALAAMIVAPFIQDQLIAPLRVSWWEAVTGVRFAPVWWPTLYALFVAYQAGEVWRDAANVFAPENERARMTPRLVSAVIGVALGLTAFLAGDLFVTEEPLIDGVRLNDVARLVCLVTAALSLLNGAWAAWRYTRAGSAPPRRVPAG